MLLKIGRLLEISGNGKWGAELLQVGTGWTGKCFYQGLNRPNFNSLAQAKNAEIYRGLISQFSFSILTYVVDLTLYRYLAPPSRFRDATGKKTTFTSRLKVGEFIKSNFPDVDPSTFFSMFIWKIPAAEGGIHRG